MNFRDRLATYADRPDECWLWPGATKKNGYVPMLRPNGTRTQAHRYAYELLVSPIPAGLTIDHLCRVRHCLNPRHLEPVPMLVNNRRGGNAQKTHCPKGHELSGDNVIVRRRTGWRACRTCANVSLRQMRRADPTRFSEYESRRDLEVRRAQDRARWPDRREKENERRRR